MAPPSNLMSAVRVSNACYDKYEPTRVLPVALRGDIDSLTAHFHATNEFKGSFPRKYAPQLVAAKPDAFAFTCLNCWGSPQRLRFSPSLENWLRCSFNSNGVPSMGSGR